MIDGKRSSSRAWKRPASHLRLIGDKERSARLAEELADERFLCDGCGRVHPLREHRTCREPTAFAALKAAARVALEAVMVVAGVVAVFWAATGPQDLAAAGRLGVMFAVVTAAALGVGVLQPRKGDEDGG